MIPLYGFLEGDTIGLVIFAYPEDTAQDLINKLQKSAAIRVKPRLLMQLVYRDCYVSPNTTVREMGVAPLDPFFVIQGEACDTQEINEQ